MTLQEVVYGVLSGKISIATAKTAAFNAVLRMNPAGAIAAAIGVLATAITGFSLAASGGAEETSELAEKANKLTDSIQNMNDSIEDSISKNESEMSMLKSKADRYDELRKAVNRTADEEAELKGLALDLQNTLGDNVSAINSLTGEYNDLSTAIDNYIKKQSAMVKLSAYENAAKNAYIVVDESQKIVDELEAKYGKEKLSVLLAGLETLKEVGTKAEDIFGYNPYGSEDSSDEQTADVRAWEKALKDIKDAQITIDTYNELLKESFVDGYNSDSSSSSADKSTSTSYPAGDFINNDELLEKFKEQREWLKHEYEMGEIDAEQYYRNLQSIRDKYLSYNIDSDEWRSVSLEIKKYYDNLSEEQKKAYDKQLAEQEKAAEDAKTARKEAYNEEKSQLEFRLRTGKISEKKYYDELAKLRDKCRFVNDVEHESWKEIRQEKGS